MHDACMAQYKRLASGKLKSIYGSCMPAVIPFVQKMSALFLLIAKATNGNLANDLFVTILYATFSLGIVYLILEDYATFFILRLLNYDKLSHGRWTEPVTFLFRYMVRTSIELDSSTWDVTTGTAIGTASQLDLIDMTIEEINSQQVNLMVLPQNSRTPLNPLMMGLVITQIRLGLRDMSRRVQTIVTDP